jgi:hypothetical protein
MHRDRLPLSALGVFSLLAFACSSSDESLKQGTPTDETWSRLADGTWTLAPGAEDARWCKKIVLTEDIYVSAMRPVHPPGTHHTTLALVADDGKADCVGSMFGAGLIYAAGAGTGELRMPKGVAMKLAKGQAILLNLHIYNSTQNEMSGLSGIDFVRSRAEDVTSEADLLLSGPTKFALPPGQKTTLTHTCAVASEQTMFTLFPHMHQHGVHIKTSVNVGGAQTVLHDGEYHFEEQYQLPIGPLTFRPGDSITTECTYENTSSSTVRFGESSDTEMCFSIMFRYPRGKSTYCTGATEGGGSSRGDGGASTGAPCASPSDTGNDVGVGKFCGAGGGQCAGNKSASLCLADFSQGEFANFCTLQCQGDADCGEAATCATSSKICIPTKCQSDGGMSGVW